MAARVHRLPTVHLHPHADVAERVLAPGDPGRALRLAQWLLDGPKMLNHHRGLWGYTGLAADGRPLTVQSTGMGGPSAAVVVEELVTLGARRIVRVGTCRALDPSLELGSLVVADAVLGGDGASRALGAPERQRADPDLSDALAAAAPSAVRGMVVSGDLFYDPDPERAGRWCSAGAVAMDMEAAAVLAVAARREVRAACLLTVTAPAGAGDARRLDPDAVSAAEQALGRAAYAALLTA